MPDISGQAIAQSEDTPTERSIIEDKKTEEMGSLSKKPSINPDNIPHTLKQSHNWVAWKEVDQEGKSAKVPVDVRTGQPAKSNDSDTWNTFGNALTYYEEHKTNSIRGIGFQLGQPKSTPFVGIDLDHCRNPQTGEIESWAQEIISTINSYTEISPSGTGIRIWVIAVLPPEGRKKGNIEMYDGNRYLTVTGNHLPGTPLTIECRHEEIENLHKEVFGERKAEQRKVSSSSDNSLLPDEALLKRVFDGKSKDKFRKLWEGDHGDYRSQSEADLALCGILASYTKNGEQIDRLYRKSGLFRDKWDKKHYADGRTYGEEIIRKAIENEVKQPPRRSRPRQTTKPSAKSLLDYNLTDAGNAECFKELYGHEHVYVPERKTWFRFDGIRFVEEGQIFVKVLKTIRAKEAEARRLIKANPDCIKKDSRLEKTIDWCSKSEGKAKLNAALAIAKSLMAKSIASFDADPMILCCLNGAVDLRTGEFFIPTKEDCLHRSANTVYEPEATCPRFLKFVEEVFNQDKELINFVQKAVGYCLTGLTNEQVLFICYGTGANGKSVFLNTIGDLLGDYSITSPASTFKDNPQDGVPNDIARMAGTRLVKTIEVKEGTRMNEERIKALTGGDRIAARFLHNEFFEFTPSCKYFLAVNHKPIIRGTDQAIWRRIRLIPFEVSFRGREDRNLYEKLKLEWPGILKWAIEGCLKWQKEGLEPVGKVKEWTNSYRAESDIIEQFLEEKTEKVKEGKVQAQDLYQAYKLWCQECGEYSITGTMFGKRLQEKGYEKRKTDRVYYLGLKLAEDIQ